jgi:1-deoxy-D-xylulose-5-phosphate reductoisomerase
MLNIYLLGATGSIGTQVLEVVRSKDDFKIKSISVGTNIQKALEIIKEFKPDFISVQNEIDIDTIRNDFPNLKYGYGEEGLIQAATYSDEDGVLINAVVGMVGLRPTIAAINKSRNILLANKETLVVGGEIITKLAAEKNVKLIPIDSEHSAILQCLQGHNIEDVNSLIITASGGAFRDKTREELDKVTIEDALNHPNWSMGKKITVDCATMVNKGLEVIEAHFLFNIPYDKIKTIIHKESIIHSMVEYNDHSVIAQMSNPDMRIPIQYALTFPQKLDYNLSPKLDLVKISSLSFKEMDFNRYPCLKLAYEVGKKGGILPTVYNASNEEAVKLFIDGKIKFLEIEQIITEAVRNANNITNPSLDDIINTAKNVREIIKIKYLN